MYPVFEMHHFVDARIGGGGSVAGVHLPSFGRIWLNLVYFVRFFVTIHAYTLPLFGGPDPFHPPFENPAGTAVFIFLTGNYIVSTDV